MKHVAEPATDRPRIPRSIRVGALVIVAAAAIWFAYSGSRPPPSTAASRTAFDFIVTWRCLACGHSRDAAAAVGPQPCEKCSKIESYVSIRYACPTHGTVPVAFQYDERGRPAQIRVAADWVPYHDEEGNLNTRCPKCGAFMHPAETMRPRPSTANP